MCTRLRPLHRLPNACGHVRADGKKAGKPSCRIRPGQVVEITDRQIMRLLLTVVRSEGISALVATHDEALMDIADEVLRLEDSHIAD